MILRGHHLVCLHFFGGEGYDSPFVENLKNVIASAKRDGVRVCSGADDVCEACPYLTDGMCRDEKEIGEMDEAALKFLNLSPGDDVTWKMVKGRLVELFPIWHDTYCIDCGWQDACNKDPLYRKFQGEVD